MMIRSVSAGNICLSSPHEAGGGTKKEKVKKYEFDAGRLLGTVERHSRLQCGYGADRPTVWSNREKHSRFEGVDGQKNHLGHTAQRRFNFGCMQ